MQTQPSQSPIDLIAALAISFVLLVTSATRGIFIAYPLLVALSLFICVLLKRGFALKAVLQMGLKGASQSLPVVQVLLLIGIITAIWMAAGTVPALVYSPVFCGLFYSPARWLYCWALRLAREALLVVH